MQKTLEDMVTYLTSKWNATDWELFRLVREFCADHQGERFDIGLGYRVSEHAKALSLYCKTKEEREAASFGPAFYEPRNARQAQKFCERLEEKVSQTVGRIIDWHVDSTDNSLWSYTVKGELGAVKVSQILAGGYNIVRLHVRNLIRKTA